ncbi:HAF repeat-containing PEP-CTERM protein [Paludisphaera borealis]|uniref:Ice-binding protein C-terminal domain-containing protein n=1 Tax=Paludisphaera borealis TaxID=1387353 RepID=A0A1U7CS14_9BACT|nr:HAF repeat-containing PEP-CTERM protein [Paludisphaera borealis]APW61686.1 hypothetical protein BSF38_03213 [Paludisphaera borealis]
MTERFAIERAWICALGASLVFLAVPARSTASPYKITVLSGDSWGQINNNGLVAGLYSSENHQGYGAVYDSNPGGRVVVSGVTPPSGSNPGSYDFRSAATSLNDRGQGVGYNNDKNEALLFDTGTGGTTPLSFPSGYGGALRITNGGTIYGSREMDRAGQYSDYQPFVYRDGRFQDLGLPPGMVSARLVAANDAGQVLVSAAATTGGSWTFNHSFLLANGRWTDLGSLVPNASASGAQAMNAQGDVVGASAPLGPDPSHAVLVPNGGQAIDLGTLAGDAYSRANAINDKGEIVGVSFDGLLQNRAFLYQNGVMTNLNDLIDSGSGWLLREAFALNNRGQILAYATQDGGSVSTLLLTPDGQPTPPDLVFPEMPVPEPSTLVVFGLAGVGLAYRKLRK